MSEVLIFNGQGRRRYAGDSEDFAPFSEVPPEASSYTGPRLAYGDSVPEYLKRRPTIMDELIEDDDEFNLHGGIDFPQYLQRRAHGTLTAIGPQILYESDGVPDYGKKWTILSDDPRDGFMGFVGVWRTHGPGPGEENFSRHFHGRIPNFVNLDIAIRNLSRPKSEHVPEDRISLVYDKQRPGKVQNWQRRDGQWNIPFP